jgi:uncharacterized DUF497 family protein
MFEWDTRKAQANREKHGVAFPDTFGVFEDPNAITIEDNRLNEQRFVSLGMDAFGRLLVVVYTWRKDSIRIISARKATRTEVREYEGQL